MYSLFDRQLLMICHLSPKSMIGFCNSMRNLFTVLVLLLKLGILSPSRCQHLRTSSFTSLFSQLLCILTHFIHILYYMASLCLFYKKLGYATRGLIFLTTRGAPVSRGTLRSCTSQLCFYQNKDNILAPIGPSVYKVLKDQREDTRLPPEVADHSSMQWSQQI